MQLLFAARSMNLKSGDTRTDRSVRDRMRKDLAKYCLKSESRASVLALDRDGELVGVKLAYKATANDGEEKPRHYTKWMRHFYWVLPQRTVHWNIFSYYVEEELRYHPTFAMEDIGTKSVCVGELLCVSQKVRGLGLGRELVRLSVDLARKRDSEAYFAIVSGVYSQKIYKDLGFALLREMAYEDMRDNAGRTLLNDTREHKKAQIAYYKLF